MPYSITERLTSDSSYHYSVGEESSPYALYDTYVDMVEKGFDESQIKGEELAEFRKQILSEGGYVYDQEKKQMLSFVQSLADIQFALGGDQILEESLPNLVKVSEILMIDEGFRLFISAHTDNVGEEDYNMEVSERRALAVYNFLLDKGI
ncbi:MAG: OmpA family protein [Flavobacteriales bacterium]|nr:OmpA family protein [Flavobacteriales bacterium]